MEEKEGHVKRIRIRIAGPIKIEKFEDAIEKELKKKLQQFRTDVLNHGDEVVVEIDDNGQKPKSQQR